MITPTPDPFFARIEIDPMILPVGTVGGPAFAQDEIEHVESGRLRMDFLLDGDARVFWNSDLEGYDEGEARLADCELENAP